MNRTPHHRWIAGDVLSWALGVTLGVILGAALLIATPLLMRRAAPATTTGTASGAMGTASGGMASGNTAGTAGQGTSGGAAAGGAGTDSAASGTASSGAAATGSTAAGSAAAGGAASDNAASGGMAEGASGTTDAGMAGAGTAASGAAASGKGDAKAGATVFASNCAGCHGAEAKGNVGPNLTAQDGPKAWSDAQMITALREGKTPERELNAIMPRFTAEQLSDGDIANIHAWIKSLN